MGMGTTATVVLLDEQVAYIGHIGDSRAYCMKDYRLYQLTQDHSFAMELLEDKEISKAELDKFRQKKYYYSCIGNKLISRF